MVLHGRCIRGNTSTALGLDGDWQQGSICSRVAFSVHLQMDGLFMNELVYLQID